MKVNLKAPFVLSSLCLPSMKARGGGSVIHITSNEAIRPSFGIGAYSVSKGALVTLAQVCAKEWARNKIRVNCIAPGLVRTEMAMGLVEMVEKSGRYPNPMQRVAEHEGVAAIARAVMRPAKPLSSTVANSCSPQPIRTDRVADSSQSRRLDNIATEM
jgi:NAD(P)-dependent dehydrogenase (short-subunit alcohol dehydrogenase family)